ncbi:hypothetical protein B0H14DRAFT_2637676 [Mycena olivaceomarginata]|nr:hypothetical protein B0H14DRAFT_2637676 [Mycena olivaceomarginata]
MRITHLLPTTLLALLSCTGNNIVRYVVLLFLAFYAGVIFVVQPLLPSARMLKLEDMVAETADILQSANEEHMPVQSRVQPGSAAPAVEVGWHPSPIGAQAEATYSRVNLTKSTLRAKLLEFELGHPAKEYLHIVGDFSADIEWCKREVKQIQIDILVGSLSLKTWPTELNFLQIAVENERQVLYNANIEEMVVVLSSGSTVSSKS